MSYYALPFTSEEITEKLYKCDNIDILQNKCSELDKQLKDLAEEQNQLKLRIENLYPDHSKFFDIEDGLIALKSEYRGLGIENKTYSISNKGVGTEGSKLDNLPECIYIPETIDGKNVAGFQDFAFARNLKITTVVLNHQITQLPEGLFRYCYNLQNVENTHNITKIGKGCFSFTSVKKLSFPLLKEMAKSAFAFATYLHTIDVGNHIEELPEMGFYDCFSLNDFQGGRQIVKIGTRCFAATRALKTLPFLENMSKDLTLGDQAFCNSRIQFDWDTSKQDLIDYTFTTSKGAEITVKNCPLQNGGAFASPVLDNTVLASPELAGIKHTWPTSNNLPIPYQNALKTKLNQKDPDWTDKYLGSTGKLYDAGCSYFTVLHIHSTLSGIKYKSPEDFITELENNEATKKYTTYQKRLHLFQNVAPCLEAMGYKCIVLSDYNDKSSKPIDINKYKWMCEALAKGAMIYTTCTRSDVQLEGDPNPNNTSEIYRTSNHGHAVAIYGFTSDGEVCVLDSIGLPTEYYGAGIIDNKFNTYTMPYQNFTGPTPGCIIVTNDEEVYNYINTLIEGGN